MRTLTTAGLLIALASGASAQVADLTVDQSQSQLEIIVTIEPGSLTDQDSSALSGMVQIELDNYGAPTTVSLVDFDVDAVSTLDLAFSLGFLGSASVTLSGVGASYGTMTPTAPVSVDALGDFTIIGVPLNMRGSGTATGSGLLAGFDGTEINLADFGTVTGDLTGNVQIVGGQVELNVALSGMGEQTMDGLTLIGTGNLTLVATGPVPEVACPGDIADDFGSLGADGMVSFGDFLALLGLVGPCPGGVPGCDGDIADDFGTLGGDGMVSFGDFLALLGLVGPCP